MKPITKSTTTVMRYSPTSIPDWNDLLKKFQMPAYLIKEFANKWDWTYVWQYQSHLGTDFIEKHIDKVTVLSWPFISYRWKLDLKFINDHSEQIDWYMLARNKKMEFSPDFCIATRGRANWQIAACDREGKE